MDRLKADASRSPEPVLPEVCVVTPIEVLAIDIRCDTSQERAT